ncbi:FAD-dependent oxidoreductase [Planococcus glaciei]|nr:FAD-dependent oxidoreductase [Planococcus glaciei]
MYGHSLKDKMNNSISTPCKYSALMGWTNKRKNRHLKLATAKREHITEYLRANFPGFEQAEISELPTELYVRETRHVISEYMLPMSDIWKNADHWDSIGYGGYPVDVQATSINDYGYVLSSPTQYAIPFRSLVPLEVENLVVVSRSAGYSSLAAGSARIIPTGMAAGEAGGAAAVHSILEDLTLRELSGHKEEMNELRYTLSRQGAMVDRFELPYPYQGKWFDESVQFLMDYGLVVGGYTNDLQVDEPLKALSFSNLLSSGLLRIDPTVHDQVAGKLNAANNKTGFDNQIFTRDSLASFLIEVFTSKLPVHNLGSKLWKPG